MIKTILIIAWIAGVLVYLSSRARKLSENAEPIEYNSKKNADVLKIIDSQLETVDLNFIEKKKNLIFEKSLEEIQASVKSGDLTYEEITAFYLYRIKHFDQCDKGFNGVMTVNPNALEIARKMDASSQDSTSALFGIPVVLKDNINTIDIPTTAGSPALEGFIPSEDAEIVKKLKDNGAIILAKTNMSEFANFKSSQLPNGFNDLKGQNMNPYDPENTSTLGSSSGSATCVTCNFSTLAIGTETDGSIISPSAIQGVVGFKPSLNKTSNEGVIPLSHSLDIVGPITRTVKDAAILYRVMSEDDLIDIEKFNENYIEGKRIGIIVTNQDSTETNYMIKKIKACGARIVTFKLDDSSIDNLEIITAEFRDDLNAYLEKYDAPFKSLDKIISYCDENPKDRALYGMDLLESAELSNNLTKEEIKQKMKESKNLLKSAFSANGLDAIAFIDSTQSHIACASGSPEITVPLHIDDSKKPHGVTFSTLANADFKALRIAYSFEQKMMKRVPPIL